MPKNDALFSGHGGWFRRIDMERSQVYFGRQHILQPYRYHSSIHRAIPGYPAYRGYVAGLIFRNHNRKIP